MTGFPRPQILPYQDPAERSIAGKAVSGYGHLRLSDLPWDLVEGQRRDGIDCVKSSSTRRVLRLVEDVHAEAPVTLYAKKNRVRTRRQGFGYRLYGSKAAREWDVGWKLVDRGLLTGRPVLLAEKREGGIVKESYLLTEAIRADCSVRALLESLHASGEEARPTLRHLGAFIEWLHAQRFYHDDLSSDHIWIDRRGVKPQFGLIDLDQSRFCRRLTRLQRVRNLFQILRSIPPEILTRDQRLVLLEPFGGEAVVPEIEALEKAKGARDTMG